MGLQIPLPHDFTYTCNCILDTIAYRFAKPEKEFI